MKRLFSIITLILLVTSLVLTASAEGKLLSDGADLLSSGEEETLSALLEKLSREADADIAVVTVDYYDGYDIEEYTQELCDGGFMSDGIVLLISIGTRDYCLTKCGSVIEAIDGKGLDFIEEAFKPYLSDGDYYVAFSIFAQLSQKAISEYKSSGKVYSGDDFAPDIEVSKDNTVTVSEGSRPVLHYFICLAAGLVLALIPMLVMQSGMKTVRSQNQAGGYIDSGSLAISVSSDRFLYRTVTRTPKPKSNSSSGGSFRGGSIGRSSSGKF